MVGIIVLILFLLMVVGTLVWSAKHDFTKNRETREHERNMANGNGQEEKMKKRTRKKVKDESESREN